MYVVRDVDGHVYAYRTYPKTEKIGKSERCNNSGIIGGVFLRRINPWI